MPRTDPPASLAEIEHAMLAAMLEDTPEAGERAARRIAADGLDPARRIAIYANTVRQNFRDALASTFPVVARLVGEDYFGQVATGYQRRHPSTSGDLNDVGHAFAAYLEALHGADEYRYLPHVARFEWACQEALLAAGHPPLDLAALAAVPPADYDALCFVVHPSVRPFEAPFPVRAIWQANVDPAVEPPLVDLGAGGDRLAIARPRLALEFLPLQAGEHAFLTALLAARPLGAALEAAAVDADFDPGTVLARFAGAGLLVGFRGA